MTNKENIKKGNNHLFWWFLLAAITAILFIPASNIKFLWIDDGLVFSAAQKLAASISTLNFRDLGMILVEEGGRLRTVYWLYQTLVYAIGGLNPAIHYAIHFLIVLITSIYIFEIVKDTVKSNLAGFFAGALYILTPTNTENLYRLGPQETLLALFVVMSMYYLIKSKLKPAVLFLFLATFVKEIGFAVWLPVLGLYLIKRIVYKKRDINLEKYCLWGTIFFSLVLVNTIFRRSGYSTHYVFDPGMMINNFLSYIDILNKDFAPFLVLFTLTAVYRIFLSIRSNRLRKDGPGFIQEVLFLVLLILYLIVQSPWEFALSRYLMPATIGLVIFMGIEFGQIVKYLSGMRPYIKQIVGMVFICYFVAFIGGNIVRVYMMGERFAYSSNFIQTLFTYLSKNVPKGGAVLYNFEKNDYTEEPIIQTGLLLKLLYNRPDIEVSYLDLGNMPHSPYFVIGTSIVKERYSRDLIEKSIKIFKKEPDIVREDKFLVLTTPYNLIKQGVIKILRSAINRKSLNSDGIYTYYIAKDYWYIYHSQP